MNRILTGELMCNKGLYIGSKANESSGLRVVTAQKFYDLITDIIETDQAKHILYRIEN